MKDLFSIIAAINGDYQTVLVHSEKSCFENNELNGQTEKELSKLLRDNDWEVSQRFEREDWSWTKKQAIYKFHLFI